MDGNWDGENLMNLPFDYNLSNKDIIWWISLPEFISSHVCSLEHKLFTIAMVWREV